MSIVEVEIFDWGGYHFQCLRRNYPLALRLDQYGCWQGFGHLFDSKEQIIQVLTNRYGKDRFCVVGDELGDLRKLVMECFECKEQFWPEKPKKKGPMQDLVDLIEEANEKTK